MWIPLYPNVDIDIPKCVVSSASSDVIAWNYAEPIWISQKYFKLSEISQNLSGLAGIYQNLFPVPDRPPGGWQLATPAPVWYRKKILVYSG